jgi:hypothetical protein
MAGSFKRQSSVDGKVEDAMGPKPRNPDVLANAASHLLIVGNERGIHVAERFRRGVVMTLNSLPRITFNS